MGACRGFTGRRAWVWGALIAAVWALPAPAAARARLSESASLFGGESRAAALPMQLACTPTRCAAFYLDTNASSRIGAVALDATGAPIEATRVDFGPGGLGLRVVAAEESFVIAFWNRILVLDSNTLSVTKDLSKLDVGRDPRGLYSNGKTVLLIDYSVDNVATTIDLGSGAIVGKQAIDHFWEPVAIPGPDQYLLFYPTYGTFRRLSSLTGTWLGPGGVVAPALIDSFEGNGYFRDGVYQLIWRHTDPLAKTETAQMFGMRVSAADGKVIDTDAQGGPAPRVLCNDCHSLLLGTFQVGTANYFWFGQNERSQSLLQINPATGLRANPALNEPDVSLPGSPGINGMSPAVEPRLVAADGAAYAANTGDLAHLVSGDPHFPGKTSALKPTDELQAASNGEGFVLTWKSEQVLRASSVSAKPKPALGIASVSNQELDFPALADFEIASAGGKYLIAGVHEKDNHELDLVWQVMDGSGHLSPLSTESTGVMLSAAHDASIALGSDGTRYLVALFTGSPIDSDGTIIAQRLSADGAVQEPFAVAASGGALLGSVDSNFALPERMRHFSVAYRAREGHGFQTYLSAISVTGPLSFETTALGVQQSVAANDGRTLLFNGGGLLDLAQDPPTVRTVPSTELKGLSHWDGNTYVRLTSLLSKLTVNQVSAKTFQADGEELEVTSQFLGDPAVAAGDGKGRSLVAYFASEAPEYVVALRAAILETEPEGVNGEAGAGGEGGKSAEAGTAGEPSPAGGTANLAGATSTAGNPGSAGNAGSAGGSDAGAAGAQDGADPHASGADQRSRACGCALPGIGPSHSGITALTLLALAFRRQHRKRRRSWHSSQP